MRFWALLPRAMTPAVLDPDRARALEARRGEAREFVEEEGPSASLPRWA
jgi:hypothetical protein